MALEKLIETAKLRPEGGTFVVHGGRELAVFRPGGVGEVFVIDNACPHANGNLSAGPVADAVVTCPWHDWRFDLRTGICTNSDRARVATYPAAIREGFVWVDLNS